MGCGASCLTREPWKNFSQHPLLKKYKKRERLGEGAFSEVCLILNRSALHVDFGEFAASRQACIQWSSIMWKRVYTALEDNAMLRRQCCTAVCG